MCRGALFSALSDTEKSPGTAHVLSPGAFLALHSGWKLQGGRTAWSTKAASPAPCVLGQLPASTDAFSHLRDAVRIQSRYM